MDAERFDSLTRRLVDPQSRRRLLRGIGVGTGTAALAALGRTASAAPDRCAVFCADQPGPRKASCKQACKQCRGDINRVCQDFESSVFSCCPQGTFCVSGEGACCPQGTDPCFGPEGFTECCGEGTFCDFETGACPPLATCPSGEPAENCFAGVTTDCGPDGACALVVDADGGCACVERACTGIVCTTGADCDGGPCGSIPGCCPETQFCGLPCGTGDGEAGARGGGWR
jgi:hypothetical protein